MSRLDPPRAESFSPAQQRVHDNIASGPRGAVVGPLGVWLWQPEFAQNAQSLGQYCRYDSSLPTRLSELAILVTGRHWGSEFEWQHHKPIALDAGIAANIVEAIRKGETPAITRSDERVVYEFATELLVERRVSQTMYDAAIDELGHETVVDLVGLLGYYTMISMTINVFEIDADGPPELA